MSKEITLENEILRGVVGSTSHGTAVEGQDDRDEMGVFIEPPGFVCGLTPCEHYIYRDKPEGVRSGPGDLDLTMYSLRKFCRLAEQGNPSILVILWLPKYLVSSELGTALVSMRDAFISRSAGTRFLGYLTAQKLKMKGERAHTVNRPQLVAQYGFDTKFAMHALRLGYQGIEVLTNRSISLPVAEPKLSILRGVRTGAYTQHHALDMIEECEARLRELVQRCTWETNPTEINRFMVEAHYKHWATRFSSTVLERRSVEAETVVQFHQPGPSPQTLTTGG